MVGGTTFAKAICSICYEDLKPIVEDIQAISICGHVFHELWFLSLSLSLSLHKHTHRCIHTYKHVYVRPMKSHKLKLMLFLLLVCVLETLVCSSGSSIVPTRRNVLALCASNFARQTMPIVSIFSPSGTRTIRCSLRSRSIARKTPKNYAGNLRDWRQRCQGLLRF
jgi:hypothetical protein